MRAIILSDSHGRFDRLASVVEKHPEAEVFLFLGDGLREWDDLRCLYPEKVFFQVRGNCDLYSDEQMCIRDRDILLKVILEGGQQGNGSVALPECLRPMAGIEEIRQCYM